MTLTAFATEHHHLLSINISCLLGAQQQTHHTTAAVERCNKWTNIQPFRRPCSAYYADSVNNKWQLRKCKFVFHQQHPIYLLVLTNIRVPRYEK